MRRGCVMDVCFGGMFDALGLVTRSSTAGRWSRYEQAALHSTTRSVEWCNLVRVQKPNFGCSHRADCLSVCS